MACFELATVLFIRGRRSSPVFFAPGVKRVVVANSDVSFGMGRMYANGDVVRRPRSINPAIKACLDAGDHAVGHRANLR